MPDGITDQRQHGDAEGQIRLRGLKQLRAADARHAIGAVGEPDRIDHHKRDDLLKRDRHHGEVVPAEPQRRHAEKGARQQGDDAAAGEAQPIAHMIIRRADPHRIGAEAEKRRLRQIDLATQAEHDRQAEDGDRKRRRLHQDVVDVAVELEGARKHHDNGGAHKIRQVPQPERFRTGRGGSHRQVFAGRAHAFSATRSPKMPCGRNTRKAISTRKAKPSL